MKITKISLRHFKAFQGEYNINLPNGCNLLLYGENGSGKSSLYLALNLFFATNSPFDKHKNIFVTTDEGFVKLDIGDLTKAPNTYEWDATTHPSMEPLIIEASKTKGFLDYKALLETHFVHRHEDRVNIFDLLVNNLLANVHDPISRRTFREEWNGIGPMVSERKSRSNTEYISKRLSEIDAGLIAVLSELTDKSNQILGIFDQNVKVELSMEERGLRFDPDNKIISGKTIELKADYYGQPVLHHHFLNEARLSAIAISIYLAALLLSPPSQLGILFLDDVLIGLDMSNRLPLLDILEKYFTDWQIILATYDKVWFDMAWQRMKDTKKWQKGELYCCSGGGCDFPVYKEDRTDYLAIAKHHLDNSDLKAAAIYIRSAYELVLKRFCDKHKLPVRYCEKVKEQKAEDFWKVVRAKELRIGANLLSASLKRDVELFRSTVLNQLSHAAPVNLVRAEVESAHKTVTALQNTLQIIKTRDLK